MNADPDAVPALRDRWQEAFAAAARARPEEAVEHTYAFAGLPVRLRVVGEALAAHIHAPFAHLAAPAAASGETMLQIDLWDESVAGVPCPDPPGGVDATAVRALAGGLLSCLRDGQIVSYARDASVIWLDRPGRRIFGWWKRGCALPTFERTRPLPLVLAEWYRDRGVYLIHAGLVARDHAGALLAGWSGAGKSTAATACLLGGFHLLGEDQIGLQCLPGGDHLGHSLFSSVRLETRHLARFARLMPHALPPDADDEPKSLIFLARIAPERLSACAPIRAIVLPRVVDAPACRAYPAGKAEALRVLGPSTVLGLPHRPGAVEFRHIARLVATVPTFWLEMGADLDAIAPCIDALLDGVCAADPGAGRSRAILGAGAG